MDRRIICMIVFVSTSRFTPITYQSVCCRRGKGSSGLIRQALKEKHKFQKSWFIFVHGLYLKYLLLFRAVEVINTFLDFCIYLSHCKNTIDRASLVAQWLRIRLPMQGTRVRAPIREDPTCHGATKPVRHNY